MIAKPMKRNESRANEEIVDAGALLERRRVRIVNGPVVLTAPSAAAGGRRFIIVAGTVVFGGKDPVPVHDGAEPRHLRTPLAHRRGAFAEFADRR